MNWQQSEKDMLPQSNRDNRYHIRFHSYVFFSQVSQILVAVWDFWLSTEPKRLLPVVASCSSPRSAPAQPSQETIDDCLICMMQDLLVAMATLTDSNLSLQITNYMLIAFLDGLDWYLVRGETKMWVRATQLCYNSRNLAVDSLPRRKQKSH